MPIPTRLIRDDQIQKFGPPRLRPLQGQRLDPRTGLWGPKFRKKGPDPRDRQKLLAKQQELGAMPAPQETEKCDLSRYRPLPGRALLKAGDEIRMAGALHIPDAHRQSEQWLTVVSVGGDHPFGPGDRVLLDRKAHRRPVTIDFKDSHLVVKCRHVAAVRG